MKSILFLASVLVSWAAAGGSPSQSSKFRFQRRLQEKPLENARLYGSMGEYAYYFLDVLVGTPPQRQSLILDTGSSLLGMPCADCKECGSHIDPPFDVKNSETASWLECPSEACVTKCDAGKCYYSQAYNEGSSIEGHFVSDIIALGDAERKNPFIRFDNIGCHDVETNLFSSQKANGIMGIAYSRTAGPSVMHALFSEAVDKSVFAICLADNGGLLTVGGYNATLHDPEPLGRKAVGEDAISWVDILSKTQYKTALNTLTFDGNSISEDSADFGPTLIDSGTTFSYLPKGTFGKVDEHFRRFCKSIGPDAGALSCVDDTYETLPCWDSSDAPADLFPHLPHLTAVLGDASVLWRPATYLYEKVAGRWCIAVDRNNDHSTLLGMSFMKNNDVIFDREQNLIGFVPAICPSFFVEDRPVAPTGEIPVVLMEHDDATEGGLWGLVKSLRPEEGISDDPKAAEGGAAPMIAAEEGSENKKVEDKARDAPPASTSMGVGIVVVLAIVIAMGCVARQTLKRGGQTGNGSYLQLASRLLCPQRCHEDALRAVGEVDIPARA